MKDLVLDRIDVKKTKVSLTMSLEMNKFLNGNEAFLNLLTAGVLAGGNKNSIRQISEIPFTKTALDFQKAEELQNEFNDLLSRFKELVNFEELTKTNETHIFK